MSRKVLISSDSTCDLSPELVEKYGVTIIPLTITDGTVSKLDGVEISVDEVFDYAKTTGKLMKTAAANVGFYADHFQNYNDEYDIVHFSISSEMSSSYANAVIAAKSFHGVYPVDSRNLSTGIGLLVLKACELRDEGKSAKEIFDYIEEMKLRVDVSFVIDTLQYLWKGGRCSGVAALGANLLKLKPCIEVKSGVMGVGKKYRGKVTDIFKTTYVDERLVNPYDIETDRIFVTHTVPAEDHAVVDEVIEHIRDVFPFKEVLETRAGCTVGVHCGPYTLGVLFVRKSPIE